MIYIAHRALFNGPDATLENHPEQVLRALNEGFDAEVDAWCVDSEWYLGHDAPTYPISLNFLNTRRLWVHCKNIAAIVELSEMAYRCNYFWHQEDDCTLTSTNYIWTYPGKPLTNKSVMVMPEYVDTTLTNTVNVDCYAICSDYVKQISSNDPNHMYRPLAYSA